MLDPLIIRRAFQRVTDIDLEQILALSLAYHCRDPRESTHLSGETAARHEAPAEIAGEEDANVARLARPSVLQQNHRSAKEYERSESEKNAAEGHK
jgi:hypothetical protein